MMQNETNIMKPNKPILPNCGNGKRLGAYIIDVMFVSVLYGILVAIFMGGSTGNISMAALSYMPFYPIILYIYLIVMELTTKRATIGKRCLKMTVVGKQMNAVGTLDILVRNAVKVLPIVLSSMFTGSFIASIGTILMIVYYLIPLCNKEHKAIHDYVAGTLVVDNKFFAILENVRKISQPQPAQPQAVQPQEEKPQVVQPLKDEIIAYKMVGMSGEFSGKEFVITKEYVLGRDPKRCSIVYPESTHGVSREHCKIWLQCEQVRIVDLASSYGTKINNMVNIPANTMVTLHDGDFITIGKDETFRIVAKR